MEWEDNYENNEQKNQIVNDPNFKLQQNDDEAGINEAIIQFGDISKCEEIRNAKGPLKSKALRQIIGKFIDGKNVKEEEVKKVYATLCNNDVDRGLEDAIFTEYFTKELNENNQKTPDQQKKPQAIKREATQYAQRMVILNHIQELNQTIQNKVKVEKVLFKVKEMKSKSKSSKVELTDKNKGLHVVNLDLVTNVVNNVVKELNPNQINDPDDKQGEDFADKKKRIADMFKKKKQDKFKNMFQIIDQTSESLKKVTASVELLKNFTNQNVRSFKNEDDSKQQSWKGFNCKEYNNMDKILEEYVKLCTIGCSTKGFNTNKSSLLQIGAMFSAVNNQLVLISKTIVEMMEFLTANYKEKVELAKFGPNSMFKINQKINNVNNKKKGKKEFVDQKTWDELSAYQKYERNFHFSDFVQNVPKGWYKQFSDEEKQTFLNNRHEWRQQRLVELAEKYKKDPDKYINYLDTLMFFWDRDRYGYFIKVDDNLKHIAELDQDSQQIYDGLKESLDCASKKGLVYNRLVVKGKVVYGDGMSTLDKIEEIRNKRKRRNGVTSFPIPQGHPFQYRQEGVPKQGGPQYQLFFKQPRLNAKRYRNDNRQNAERGDNEPRSGLYEEDFDRGEMKTGQSNDNYNNKKNYNNNRGQNYRGGYNNKKDF